MSFMRWHPDYRRAAAAAHDADLAFSQAVRRDADPETLRHLRALRDEAERELHDTERHLERGATLLLGGRSHGTTD